MSNYLLDRRVALGLTQKEVAAAVGVSEATVSRWESGAIANMRRDKINLYAKALHTSPTFIMTGEGISTPTAPAAPRTPVSPSEHAMLAKFRVLDPRGQSNVLAVLEHEYSLSAGEGPAPSVSHGA